ncbi:MAG: hypothetical protein PHC88_08125 [Terrimicrobiaceae bacterium]|nr:hypothetical protein [Terrimicrobiaceae bacterium]
MRIRHRRNAVPSFMIYPFPLQFMGLAVGALLILFHAFAIAAPGVVMPFLRAFPRSQTLGTALLLTGTIWAFWLVVTMDLGEFARLRGPMLLAVPIGAALTWKFVDEFLAVRALGILALLAADCLLDAAFLRPEVSRLVLVVLAYAWIFAGLFLVGMPYILRDLIAWLLGTTTRYRQAAIAGILYGVILVICAAALW